MSYSYEKAIAPRQDDDSGDLSQAESLLTGSDDIIDENDASSQHDDMQSSAQQIQEASEAKLKDISFGALAEAQAKLPNLRKRKLADRDNGIEDEPDQSKDAHRKQEDTSREKYLHISRSSKHAPTIMSSRIPVSRRREVFSPPPAEKSRDPRFDAAITSDARHGNTSSTLRAAQNYAFLSDYQATEVLDLKVQLKKSKDFHQQADLKRKIMSIEAKARNADTQRREVQILQEHKRKEKEAIKEGRKSKPYYLKQSELRKQINQERHDAMGKKAQDKSEKRKKKREKTKESRDMPRTRRFVD